MLSFFKRWKKVALILPLEQVAAWLEDKKKDTLSPILASLEDLRSSFDSKKSKVVNNTRNLAGLQLKNPNIPVRELHFMQGNRDAHILKVLSFCENAHFPNSLGEVASFRENFSRQLADLAKSTEKSYMVLQHFFAIESREIFLGIKAMEDTALQTSKLDIGIEGEAEEKLAILLASVAKRVDSFAQQKLRAESLALEKERLESLMKRKMKIESATEYLSVLQKKQELESSQRKEKALAHSVSNDFSKIDHSLRKFAKITLDNEELAVSYLNNPVKALLDDEAMQIGQVLRSLSDKASMLDLNEKKREKTVQVIESLLKDLSSRRMDLLLIGKNIACLKSGIAASSAEQEFEGIVVSISTSQHAVLEISSGLEGFDSEALDSDVLLAKQSLEASLAKLANNPVQVLIR